MCVEIHRCHYWKWIVSDEEWILKHMLNHDIYEPPQRKINITVCSQLFYIATSYYSWAHITFPNLVSRRGYLKREQLLGFSNAESSMKTSSSTLQQTNVSYHESATNLCHPLKPISQKSHTSNKERFSIDATSYVWQLCILLNHVTQKDFWETKKSKRNYNKDDSED